MKTVELGMRFVTIGRAGENGVSRIAIDVSGWVAEYPNGTGAIVYKRPDGATYPLVSECADGKLYAVLGATDTAISGTVKVEAQWLDDGKIAKSATYECVIERSIGEAGAVPTDRPSWVDEVLQAAAGIGSGGGTASAVEWDNVQSKPDTFPPAEHEHDASEITGLATVATTGSYNDLEDTPTIPDEPQIITSAYASHKNAPCNKGFTPTSEAVITFYDDDGTMKFCNEHVPIYKAHGIKATFAIVACRAITPVGITTSGDPYEAMGWDKIHELVRDGFDMQSHTWSHARNVFNSAYNGGVTESEIDEEYAKADAAFAAQGLDYCCMTFPFGASTEAHLRLAKRYARYGVNCRYKDGLNYGDEDPMDLNRLAVTTNCANLANIKSKIDTAKAQGAWLIILTHAGGDEPHAAGLEEIIQYIESKNIRIETFSDAARMKAAAYYTGGGENTFRVMPDGLAHVVLTDAAIKTLFERAYALGYAKAPTDTNVYIAKYNLSGDPNAAVPATLTDESGNGHDMTVSGGVTYYTDGTMRFDATGEMAYIAPITDLPTKYKIHIKFTKTATATHRLMVLPTHDLNFFMLEQTMSSGFWEYVGIESADSDRGFTPTSANTLRLSYAVLPSRISYPSEITLDMTVDGNNVTSTICALIGSAKTEYTGAEQTDIVAGITTAIGTGGIYLGNRAAGDRALVGSLLEFWIEDLT